MRTLSAARQRNAAFTMVEIAISLAVIGFALVAIIGVLPTGLGVQRENRERTLVDHDANFFYDAIRSGSKGPDDLTNYVFAITNFWAVYDTSTTPWSYDTPPDPMRYDGYSQLGSDVQSMSPPPFMPIDTGYRIIGLLSRPKLEPWDPEQPELVRSNYTIAYVRALSGSATEKFPQNNPAVLDLAFSYRMTSDVYPVALPDNRRLNLNLQRNLHEVRFLFRWPLLPNGNTGNGRELYRAQVGGILTSNVDNLTGHPLYFFESSVFQRVLPPPS